jgi:glutathione S-transferase
VKLYVSLTSPYARKARVLVRELDLTGSVEEIVVDPWSDESLRKINPLCKVPALVLDDGSALFNSPLVCEYLNELGGGKFFPGNSLWRGTAGRWRALGLQALGDGVLDAAVRVVLEGRLPEDRRNRDAIARQEQAIMAALALMERAVAGFAETPTIGEITLGCALGYLDFRGVCTDWREGRPALSAWYERFARYPSMIATAPPA